MSQKMRWKADANATSPPSKTMGPEDRASLLFDAKEPISSADLTLFRVQDDQSLTTEGVPIPPFSVATPHVTALVEGLSVGSVYKLAMTFQTASNRRWTRVLTIICTI